MAVNQDQGSNCVRFASGCRPGSTPSNERRTSASASSETAPERKVIDHGQERKPTAVERSDRGAASTPSGSTVAASGAGDGGASGWYDPPQAQFELGPRSGDPAKRVFLLRPQAEQGGDGLRRPHGCAPRRPKGGRMPPAAGCRPRPDAAAAAWMRRNWRPWMAHAGGGRIRRRPQQRGRRSGKRLAGQCRSGARGD